MTQTTPHTVSVVVPAWSSERREQLDRCLKAIARQTMRPSETIVVIDHNPELLAWIEESFGEVTAVANRHDRGVVGARNTGAEQATGELIVLTDDDTEAEPDWIERLEVCFADPQVVGVTGRLLPAWMGSEPRWFPREFYWVFGCSYIGLPTEVAPVRNPIAANMAIRASALREVGGFQPGVVPQQIKHRGKVVAGGHALEDTQLGIRVGKRWPGKKWLYQPHATVHHLVTPQQASLGYLLRRSFEEGASKAQLAETVGSEEGLSSERRYVSVVLPRGFARGVGRALRGEGVGLLRSAAIVMGLLASGLGFLTVHLSRIGRR